MAVFSCFSHSWEATTHRRLRALFSAASCSSALGLVAPCRERALPLLVRAGLLPSPLPGIRIAVCRSSSVSTCNLSRATTLLSNSPSAAQPFAWLRPPEITYALSTVPPLRTTQEVRIAKKTARLCGKEGPTFRRCRCRRSFSFLGSSSGRQDLVLIYRSLFEELVDSIRRRHCKGIVKDGGSNRAKRLG